MIHVEYLHEESYNGEVVFVALEYLKLEKLPNLMRLSREDGETMFPCLSELSIFECPKLLGLPSLPSINHLGIQRKCKQDLLSSIHKLSLEYLEIKENEELTCFPDGMLQNLISLKELKFNCLPKLEELQIEIFNLSAIRRLYIWSCDNLKLLLQGLHSLKHLDILGCRKFNVSTGFPSPTCLEYLFIRQCIEVEGLHEALQHMTALKELILWDLPNLESLPDCFGNLPLLSYLSISDCDKLRCLPTSISLSRLQTWRIWNCPKLQKRCQKKKGEDWPKIAHVPDIYVPRAGYRCDACNLVITCGA